jgi:hypothetical protein
VRGTGWFAVAAAFLLSPGAHAQDGPRRFVYPGPDGKLAYDADARGNRIPDFSHAGYGGGGVALPAVPVRVVVPPREGDGTARIQAALDHVAGLRPDAGGFRGAVLLQAGRHEVAGALRLTSSGVVLRGQGPKRTVIVATGTGRRTLIQIRGRPDRTVAASSYTLADKYVPAGASRLRLASAAGLKAGDRVLVEHPSTKEWIAALRMDRFPADGKGSWLDWRPGTLDLRWDRAVTKVEGDTITLDSPLTSALDATLSTARVRPYSWPGRVSRVGVEDLRCESACDGANPHDEEHSWNAIGVECAEDVWVRRVTAARFAGSAVAVWETARRVTVEDVESLRPVSELGGYRRHTFYTSGQQTLFRRCTAEDGRHDFAAGYLAAGPNAFVECRATRARQFSGPIESWCSGVLYDNITIDGAGLALTNREIDGHGVGWAAADCVLWQCAAPVITCRNPPVGNNWAIGCWGQFTGDGHWRSMNQFVKPGSLYAAQLADRLGGRADTRGAPPVDTGSTPSIDAIGRAKEASGGRKPPERAPRGTYVPHSPQVSLKNGWLVRDGKPLSGTRLDPVWWKGHVLPSRAGELGVGVTRFVPGRDGAGFTDDLDELTDAMRASHQVILSHHWGLWYDRRRDDHQMLRRADGEVWPPFYELPWARSGKGQAWDGLSKYDLTKFNPWYFARLKEFADHCDRKGLVLVVQMYFQHNLLEAGAHWADFPWRPANCLQETGFPEPPPYANNKRVFLAEAFYDVEHPARRPLHRAYIRHCLDVLGGNSNVLFLTGEEFTGHLAFVRFWLDTIAEWEKEKGRKVLVGLSCTKDVQDAVLEDPARGPRVSVIDLKYWWYTAGGELYAPKGGESLSPRQQLRQWKGIKSRSNASVARMVREYRLRYPDKAVLCSLDGADGWAVVAAGGSVPALPPLVDGRLLTALGNMKPFASKGLAANQLALADEGREYLVYSPGGEEITLALPGGKESYSAFRVHLKTGETRPAEETIRGGATAQLRAAGPAVVWLTRKR